MHSTEAELLAIEERLDPVHEAPGPSMTCTVKATAEWGGHTHNVRPIKHHRGGKL